VDLCLVLAAWQRARKIPRQRTILSLSGDDEGKDEEWHGKPALNGEIFLITHLTDFAWEKQPSHAPIKTS